MLHKIDGTILQFYNAWLYISTIYTLINRQFEISFLFNRIDTGECGNHPLKWCSGKQDRRALVNLVS